MSRPSTKILPPQGSTILRRREAREDFPAPVLPTMPIYWKINPQKLHGYYNICLYPFSSFDSEADTLQHLVSIIHLIFIIRQ